MSVFRNVEAAGRCSFFSASPPFVPFVVVAIFVRPKCGNGFYAGKGNISDSFPGLLYGWRGEYELTSQDSAGRKNSTILTSSLQVRKGIENRQVFSQEMALNMHEKGFTISKTITVCKK